MGEKRAEKTTVRASRAQVLRTIALVAVTRKATKVS